MGEDATDAETIAVLVRRLVPASVGVKTMAPPRGRAGSAKLLKAAPTFMRDLQAKGCTLVILVHDLDLSSANNELNDEPRLRARLSALPVPKGLERAVCIPVEELEAWFWADQAVLDRVGKHAKASTSPHLIKKPKEQLKALAWRTHHKSYATNDNPELARLLDLEICANRCPAFAALRDVVVRHCAS